MPLDEVEQFQQTLQMPSVNFFLAKMKRFTKSHSHPAGRIAFDLFLQVRNKVISAYQEVMRMQM